MSKKHDYIESQMEICRHKWFSKHEVKCGASGDIFDLKWETALLFSWQNPASWNYGCRFIIHGRWLIIVGDIGESVFEWSDYITLNFLAGLDFGYFISKCRASDSGRDYSSWDSEIAAFSVAAFISESHRECHAESAPEPEWIDILRSIPKHTYKFEFEGYIRDANKVGLDGHECSELIESGKVPSVHAIGHFIGLQMAIGFLKSSNPVNPVNPV